MPGIKEQTRTFHHTRVVGDTRKNIFYNCVMLPPENLRALCGNSVNNVMNRDGASAVRCGNHAHPVCPFCLDIVKLCQSLIITEGD